MAQILTPRILGSIDTPANLALVDLTYIPTGQHVAAKTAYQGLWFLRNDSTDTPDGVTVVDALGQAGNWHRDPAGTPGAHLAAAWYVDTAAGSDSASGITSLTPLASVAEIFRRIGVQEVAAATTVTINSGAAMLLSAFGGIGSPVDGYARMVVTSLGACTVAAGVLTVTANGALGTQDGLTPVVGNVVYIPEGTTNLPAAGDAGPYIVTTLGTVSTQAVLTRPRWYANGAAMRPNLVVSIGPSGTLFGGSSWKSFADFSSAKVIGTDAPLAYPDCVTQSVSFGGGSPTGTATVTNVPIRSVTKSNFILARKTAATPTLTLEYAPLSITAGVLGTASVAPTATVAAGTINTADGSTLLFSIINW